MVNAGRNSGHSGAAPKPLRGRVLAACMLLLVLCVSMAACAGRVAQPAQAPSQAQPPAMVATTAAMPEPTAACAGKAAMAAAMGRYEVVAVKRYAGGMTRREQAVQSLGKVMVSLSPERAVVTGNQSINHPGYTVVCQPRVAEGEVPSPAQRRSWFYGFGTNRQVVVVLQVRDPADQEPTPYYQFELVASHGKPGIWYLYDGWLYQMRKLP